MQYFLPSESGLEMSREECEIQERGELSSHKIDGEGLGAVGMEPMVRQISDGRGVVGGADEDERNADVGKFCFCRACYPDRKDFS